MRKIDIGGREYYGGVDFAFNSLRVFPPAELEYPDMIEDDDFYEKIGRPHLKQRYSNNLDDLETPIERKGFAGVVEAYEASKNRTTQRLKTEILDKIDWQVWDTHE